jgi:hypothetical protein
MAKEKCNKKKEDRRDGENFKCKICGRTVAKKKHLCKPQKPDK